MAVHVAQNWQRLIRWQIVGRLWGVRQLNGIPVEGSLFRVSVENCPVRSCGIEQPPESGLPWEWEQVDAIELLCCVARRENVPVINFLID